MYNIISIDILKSRKDICVFRVIKTFLKFVSHFCSWTNLKLDYFVCSCICTELVISYSYEGLDIFGPSTNVNTKNYWGILYCLKIHGSDFHASFLEWVAIAFPMIPHKPMSTSLRRAACSAVQAVQASVAAVIEPECSLKTKCAVEVWVVIVIRRELPPCFEVNN